MRAEDGPARALLAVGISHDTAALPVRERAALDAPARRRLLSSLRSEVPASEAVALSTCNRTEVYAVTDAGESGAAARRIRAAIAGHTRITASELAENGYALFEDEAVEHLFEVVAGLRSHLLGEPEIVAQVREAVELARQEGSTGELLEALFAAALQAGKRVRAGTAIGRGALSLSSVALSLAEDAVGGLAGRSVLLVGAGAVARSLGPRLARAGVAAVVVANRSLPAAVSLAERIGGPARAVTLAGLPQELPHADLVICATGAPGPVLDRTLLEAGAAPRAGTPLVVLDLAVPRDVEPGAEGIPGVVVHDLDQVQRLAASHREQRRREVPRAAAILSSEAARFRRRRERIELDAEMDELRRLVERARRAELERVLERCGPVGEGELERLDAVTSAVLNRLLHLPTLRIRQAGAHEEAARHLAALRELLAPAPELAGETRRPARLTVVA